nr:MAG TPA: Receptor recognition protein, Long tail, Helical sandwich, Tail fiber [Caudoviricetes sp.]
MDVQYLKYVDITLTDGTALNLTNSELWSNGFSFDDSVSSDNSFDIGSAIINTFTLSINNFNGEYSDYDFDGAEVVCYIGLELDDGTTEKVRICTATVVDQPEDETVTIDLTCEDNMHKFDQNYSKSDLTYPATLRQIMTDACDICKVPLQSTRFNRDDYVVQVRPDDEALTFRQVIQWVAQISCQWARCDEYGRLCFGWYKNITEEELVIDENGILKTQDNTNIALNFSDTDGTLSVENGTFVEYDGILRIFATDGNGNISEISSTYGFTPKHTDVVITGVRVTDYSDSSSDEAQSYLYGTEGYVLSISGNKLIRSGDGQTVASMIAEKCVGMSFRPFEAECPTDISLEAGDSLLIVDRNGRIYKSFLTSTILQPGSGQKIACNAQSAAKNSSVQYSQITQAFVTARKMVQKESSAREEAVKRLENALKESSGLYETSVPQEDGSVITYLHDKPTLKESKNVIKFTAEAIGVSNDGGETYPYGFFLTGDLIAKILYAHGINADYINTGALTVKDEKGNVIFQVNIDTKTVRMSADVIQIGDKTLSAKITELENSISQGVNISVTLSNDYQVIPVDVDGNIIGDFPDVRTEVNAYYGTTDISSECLYTITTSDNIAGSWNSDTHTYTVTSLTADSGWVDIRVTYLQTLSITQRFTVVKLYAGPAGEPGILYILNSSDTVIVRSNNGTYSPDTITFSAYSRKGEESRQPYSGRFVIEETVDGKTWKAIYTSASDEASVTDHLNNVLVYHKLNGLVTQNVALSDDNSSLLGVPREVSKVRCSLYAAGGTVTLIDRQTIPVVIEMDDLTQSDIVDILTNNGEWKGIYYLNGRLYISFDAARGGTLKLGGKANGNGKLYWYDSFDNLIGNFDNEGILIANPDLDDSGYRIGKNGIEFIINSKASGDVIVTEGGGISIVDIGGKLAVNVDCYQLTSDYGIIDEATINKINSNKKALEIGGNLTINGYAALKKLDIDSTAKTLTVSSNGTVFKSSSSSKRYKDIGATVSKKDIDDWYNIESYWAKYKNGYLREGDENEGRYIPMFVAENVAEHLPEASIHENGLIEDWNARVMIPAMFAMIKQQHEEINELKQIVKELQGGE